ncbi:hypothetical protein L6452_24854 [Arctium lappa]|uniref:Uncharacterized protein n=1 Tax=Arctium lappa TaxID=4217 RepID=A0ACB9ABC8_ARCLA|nr:hypothetical protein L6452_24854 [Arctium lappa]
MFTYNPSTVFNHEPYAVVPSPGSYYIPPSMHYSSQPYPPRYCHNPWEQPSYGPVPLMNSTTTLPVAPPPPPPPQVPPPLQGENCDVARVYSLVDMVAEAEVEMVDDDNLRDYRDK